MSLQLDDKPNSVPEPLIVPATDHRISVQDIDRDALKVLSRLRQGGHLAYLVGGSVRDLLIGRRPKDFDIGTSAYPYAVKRLFRNCWIIGRRFRLAHVKFGSKIIEVATFRKSAAEEPEPADRLIRRDNTFGTPREDAFRRDFTINGLFYDLSTASVIDYVGGLSDLRHGRVSAIGDPTERFQEDPVRMIRAIALAARLGFEIDPAIYEAIARHRTDISKSSPARLLEEFYKILRGGAAEKAFRNLHAAGLLEPLSEELDRTASAGILWSSLAKLDLYRGSILTGPSSLTNAILLGTLLVPAGFSPSRFQVARSNGNRLGRPVTLGSLPLARRDLERLRQLLMLQPRLLISGAVSRSGHALIRRPTFAEALIWLEIHGESPELVESWKTVAAGEPLQRPSDGHRVRRRRRRRGTRIRREL